MRIAMETAASHSSKAFRSLVIATIRIRTAQRQAQLGNAFGMHSPNPTAQPYEHGNVQNNTVASDAAQETTQAMNFQPDVKPPGPSRLDGSYVPNAESLDAMTESAPPTDGTHTDDFHAAEYLNSNRPSTSHFNTIRPETPYHPTCHSRTHEACISPSVSLSVKVDYRSDKAKGKNPETGIPKIDASGSSKNKMQAGQTDLWRAMFRAQRATIPEIMAAANRPKPQVISPIPFRPSIVPSIPFLQRPTSAETPTEPSWETSGELSGKPSSSGYNNSIGSLTGNAGYISNKNPFASLDRGPSLRLQRALAEDQERPKTPLLKRLAPTQPIPSRPQNGLLQATERAGVWRNPASVFGAIGTPPSTDEAKAKLKQEGYEREWEMQRVKRREVERELAWKLWGERERRIERQRKRAREIERLETELEMESRERGCEKERKGARGGSA
ncbi:hypothetical protein CORC01_09673 [Colletotrichum orchidophilum]|uniref:Uncharacterized protein n=1 Tax=Colletotrichum orchidophilum TaxID=1209926 RepID=A0A1G4B0W9_9PEZI|nr:uncharacterized protein CORC01_09673 [Colletotrichum orchidophilum]OHE95016.1 hypothetical protein CORC01_09673 [Colletotrichum orchidophilum]